MTTTDYSTMDVGALRRLARDRAIGTGVQRAGASKATLVAALETGAWPDATTTTTTPAGADALATALRAALAGAMDEERVRSIAAEVASAVLADYQPPAPRIDDDVLADAIRRHAPVTQVQVATSAPVAVGIQHRLWPVLATLAANRVHTLLVGPAGTGKTSAAAAVAKALGLPFEPISVGPTTQAHQLIGYVDANGTFHDTALTRAYRSGGVFLLDEFDAGHAGIMTILNAALAGDVLPTPAGPIERHKDFICVASANTYGTGASREYVGRNQLDAATLDRFFVLDWPLDDAMESMACGISASQKGVDLMQGGATTPEAWLAVVRQVRDKVDAEKIRTVISPRSSITGGKLCAVLGRYWLTEGLLARGMAVDARRRVGL